VNRWWKAKIKPLDDAPEADEDKVGLVPRTYVEEVSSIGKPALVALPIPIGRFLSMSTSLVVAFMPRLNQIPPISHSRALYDYTSTSPDELSMTAEDLLEVFEQGEEWNLVRHAPSTGKIGFVPANYTEAVDQGGDAGLMGDEVHEVDASKPMSPGPDGVAGGYVSPTERVAGSVAAASKEKDIIETWSVSVSLLL
jgi:hypothetical protein